MPEDPMQRLTPNQNMQLGLLAGVCCKLCNYPLLSWKNAAQQSLPISLDPKVVYRGLPMACLNLGGTTAVQFYFTGLFQRMLHDGGGPLPPEKVMLTSFLGGCCSGVPGSIWELTMIQQQRFGGSIFGTPPRIVREYGGSAVVRGMTMCIGREALFTMAMLGICPLMQQQLMDSAGLSEQTALATGALSASIFAGVMTHPMDTIKTCMQGDLGGQKFKGITATGKVLCEEYGVAGGLYKGLGWRVGLIATTFFLVNQFKQTLAPKVFPAPSPSKEDSK